MSSLTMNFKELNKFQSRENVQFMVLVDEMNNDCEDPRLGSDSTTMTVLKELMLYAKLNGEFKLAFYNTKTDGKYLKVYFEA